MKVLHLLKTNTGAAWAFRLISRLSDYRVESTVVMPSATDGYADRYKSIGVKVVPATVDIASIAPWALPGVCRTLREVVEKEPYDIVHSHFFGTTITARIALSRCEGPPRLFQIPGPLHLEHPIPRLMDMGTAREMDFYVATTSYTRELLLRAGVDAARIFLSYYGTDVDDFHGHRTGRLRDNLGIPHSSPLVGLIAYMYPPKRYIAQFTGIKGHEYFIDAMAIVRNRIPAARGILIGCQWGGGHDYEDRLRRRAQQKCPGAIIFAGYRQDVQDIYRDLDVAVHPSLSENAGGAVESLLSGVPTVASRVGGLPEVVLDGETGLTATPGSSEELADKICYLLEHPDEAHRMALDGQARVRKMFDISNTSRGMYEIYEDVLGEP